MFLDPLFLDPFFLDPFFSAGLAAEVAAGDAADVDGTTRPLLLSAGAGAFCGGSPTSGFGSPFLFRTSDRRRESTCVEKLLY